MIDYGDSYLKGKDITFLFIIKTFSGFWCDPHGQIEGAVGMVGAVGGVRMVGDSPRLTYSAIADNPEGGQARKRWREGVGMVGRSGNGGNGGKLWEQWGCG